jgi:predicted ATP-binding protein involved in virulence
MYVQKIEIKNIRSLSHVVMTFPNPAGWHVVIGDNGFGKSSLLRAIAISMIDKIDAFSLQLPSQDWIQKSKKEASIRLQFLLDFRYDHHFGSRKETFPLTIKIHRQVIGSEPFIKSKNHSIEYSSSASGGFSASFGAFRRFTGGDKEWSKFYESESSAIAHLSLFREGVALTKSLEWLNLLKFRSFEKDELAIQTLAALKKFINESDLLPSPVQLEDITSQGILFNYQNGNQINITELSDGFRSLLSLVFELIRQLVHHYGHQVVFESVLNGTIRIEIPGVVMIDEIDAHLHPTWQTRIGQWFTKHFPKIQFIVATHSPLICRACENGSIWRLASTLNGTEVREITGTYKKRLIYGTILDAYGTELFGETASIPEETDKKLNRLTVLNQKSMQGETSDEEESELVELKTFLTPTH